MALGATIGFPIAVVAAVPTAVLGWRWWKHRAENGIKYKALLGVEKRGGLPAEQGRLYQGLERKIDICVSASACDDVGAHDVATVIAVVSIRGHATPCECRPNSTRTRLCAS